MSQVHQDYVRLLAGIYLVLGILLCSSNVKAQTVPDTLWAWDGLKTVSACQNPTSSASLATCFSGLSPQVQTNYLMATDGINIYTASGMQGWGYSCPISGLGTGCSQISVGPYVSSQLYQHTVSAIAAGGGFIYTAQTDGTIWKCPSTIQWTGTIPTAAEATANYNCVQLDSSGNNYASSLVLVNDTLYVGLEGGTKNFGLIWSCNVNSVNDCATLDNPGKNNVLSLTAGAGYLWAGLENGIVWRCDLEIANSCVTWEKASQQIGGLAYDGQGTLGAVTGGYYYDSSNTYVASTGVLWSCPTSYANGCTTLVNKTIGSKDVYNFTVAAGEGSVWGSGFVGNVYSQSSYGTTYVTLGNTAYTADYPWQYNNRTDEGFTYTAASLLYIPAGGMTTGGSARVQVPFTGDATRLARVCSYMGRRAIANVTISGPYGKVKRRVNLCKYYDANAGQAEIEFGALDLGAYRVTVQNQSYYGQADFVLNNKNVQGVSVPLNKKRRK
jgi:hypothetical protein